MSKATVIVHWPGKDTAACEIHLLKLENVARAMGFTVTSTPIVSTPIVVEQECTNCVNEEKKRTHS
jgi:hypothetical protein